MRSGSRVKLNPILTFVSPAKPQSDSCHLSWDLRDPPSASAILVQDPFPVPSSPTIHIHRCRLGYQLISSDDATNPPVSRLQIICDLLPFRWPIEARNDRGVKVHDVIEAIYKVAQVPLRPDEWERMSSKDRNRIQAAYKLRWMNAAQPEVERQRGVRRIDCLLHYTRFGGLSISFDRSYRCVLTLSRQLPHLGTSNTFNECPPSSSCLQEPSRQTNRLRKNRRRETGPVRFTTSAPSFGESKGPIRFPTSLPTAGYSRSRSRERGPIRFAASTPALGEIWGGGMGWAPSGRFASYAPTA